MRARVRRRVLEGEDCDLFEGPEPGTLVRRFKDGPAAPPPGAGAAPGAEGAPEGPAAGAAPEPVEGRGVLNNRVSEFLMRRLGEAGVPHCLIRRLNMREQLVHALEELPFTASVHNLASGDFARRFRLAEGEPLPRSVVEYASADASLGRPMVSEEHITAFGWAAPEDIDDVFQLALRANDFLSGLCLGSGLRLMRLDLSFGRFWEDDLPRVALAGAITPGSLRLWDLRAGAPLAAPGEGGAAAAREAAARLGALEAPPAAAPGEGAAPPGEPTPLPPRRPPAGKGALGRPRRRRPLRGGLRKPPRGRVL